jgi:hypothetical protein
MPLIAGSHVQLVAPFGTGWKMPRSVLTLRGMVESYTPFKCPICQSRVADFVGHTRSQQPVFSCRGCSALFGNVEKFTAAGTRGNEPATISFLPRKS